VTRLKSEAGVIKAFGGLSANVKSGFLFDDVLKFDVEYYEYLVYTVGGGVQNAKH
jgi:hypothetical protein